MRVKRKAKQCEYLLIYGFSMSEAGWVAPKITLNRGNGYGEEIVRTIEVFPLGTKYDVVKERAKELSVEMGVTLGRDFSQDEWLGPEVKMP